MKKMLVSCLILLACGVYAEDCIHQPRNGQACLGAKNLPSNIEILTRDGRKMELSFSKSNMFHCHVALSSFRPTENYQCSIITYGEERSFTGQASHKGIDQFDLDLTPENKVRCSCTSPTSVIEILPENNQNPLKVTINWNK